MVDYLYHCACDVPGLWTDKGVEGEEAIIRDMLDQGIPFPELEQIEIVMMMMNSDYHVD